MPLSAETLRAAVEREVTALERLCEDMEAALAGRKWIALQRSFGDARRLSHALKNAMESATAVRDADFDARMYARIRRVSAVGDDQLARLRSYRDAISERLQAIAKHKAFARSIGARDVRSRAHLISDVR